VWGRNWQSIPSGTSTFNTYNFSGIGQNAFGIDFGLTVQSSWAWGSGTWTGAFDSLNLSLGPLAGSIFWTPGRVDIRDFRSG